VCMWDVCVPLCQFFLWELQSCLVSLHSVGSLVHVNALIAISPIVLGLPCKGSSMALALAVCG
jgi:hypothetical protein